MAAEYTKQTLIGNLTAQITGNATGFMVASPMPA
jgi:hypothetical protein